MMTSFKPPTSSLVIDAMSRAQPVIFRAFYPRRYNDIGGYYSPRLVAANLTCIATYSTGHQTEALTVVEKLVAPSLKYLSEHRMPLMFLDPQFLRAVLMTDFPEPITWPDLHLPYEHGIFMLPKGALLTPEGHDIAFIHYSRKRRGETFLLPDATSTCAPERRLASPLWLPQVTSGTTLTSSIRLPHSSSSATSTPVIKTARSPASTKATPSSTTT